MGERPERGAALQGRAAGLGGGQGAVAGGLCTKTVAREQAQIASSPHLQDGNPVPFTLPLGIAWNASAPWLVVVFLS